MAGYTETLLKSLFVIRSMTDEKTVSDHAIQNKTALKNCWQHLKEIKHHMLLQNKRNTK